MKILFLKGQKFDLSMTDTKISKTFKNKISTLKKHIITNLEKTDLIIFPEDFLIKKKKYDLNKKIFLIFDILKNLLGKKKKNSNLEISNFEANFLKNFIDIKLPIFIISEIGDYFLNHLHNNFLVNYFPIFLNAEFFQMKLILKKNENFLSIFFLKNEKLDKNFFDNSKIILDDFFGDIGNFEFFKVLVILKKIEISKINDLLKIYNNNKIFDFIIFKEVNFLNFEDFSKFEEKNKKNLVFENFQIINILYKNEQIIENEFYLNVNNNTIFIEEYKINFINNKLDIKFKKNEKINFLSIFEKIKKKKLKSSKNGKFFYDSSNYLDLQNLEKIKKFIEKFFLNSDEIIKNLLDFFSEKNNQNLKNKKISEKNKKNFKNSDLALKSYINTRRQKKIKKKEDFYNC